MKKIITCHDRNKKPIKTTSDNLIIRPSVYGLLIKNNKILLVPHWDGYDFPGGGIEKGETIMESLKREFIEETGISVKPLKLLGCQDSFFFYEKKYYQSIMIYYTCKMTGGKITTKYMHEYEKEYLKEAEWIDLKDTKKIKFYNSIDSIKLIKKALKIKNLSS